MKKITFLIIATALIFNGLSAQNNPSADTIKINNLDEIIISANKVEETKRTVAQQIQVISAKQIAQLNPQTAGDILTQSGNVLVQKSQQGGGSPILRGFEASRVLLVIDGVRMNNLIYRAGHLQNVVTIDPSMLERAEVIFGPSSTVYGSDALGGVVHFHTKNPTLNTEGAKNLLFKANSYVRFSSANNEKTAHLDFNVANKRFGSLTSISISDFGDLKMGKKTQALDTLWGLRKTYQMRINNRDTILQNDNIYKQISSGYQQIDVLQKFLFQQTDKVSHGLNVQFSNSTDIPRYDRLTDVRGGSLAQGDWYYGPQFRFLVAYQLTIKGLENSFFQNIRLNANYQDLEESRFTRNFGAPNRTDRIESVKVNGMNLDFQRITEGGHNFRTGIDFQYSTVNSIASRFNVNTQTVVGKASTRYPDGNNSMLNAATYLTHTWKLNNSFTLNEGVRLGLSNLRSEFVSTEFYKLNIGTIEQNNFIWTGNLGLIYSPKRDFKLSLLSSTGFRVPNVDDLGKVFDTNTADKLVIVPNENVKPERTYNLDATIAKTFGDVLTLEATAYQTWYRNAIVVAPFQLNGQDSIVYDGVKSQVQANQNRNKAQLIGLSLNAKARFTEGVFLTASYNFTRGRVHNSDGSETPLDHVAPSFGRIGFQLVRGKLDAESYVLFNGWKCLKDYSNSGEDNLQYATKDGMPSWWTANLRVSYALLRGLKLQVGVENLANVQYRVFASGIHAASRNVYGTLRFSF